MYVNDSDFVDVYKACEHGAFHKFYLHDGFLFRGKNNYAYLYVSVREMLVRESHSWGV